MAVEFSVDSDDEVNFIEFAIIPINYSQTEEVPLRFAPAGSGQDDARNADRAWVKGMSLLGQIGHQSVGILLLSDGVTAHCVTLESLSRDIEDYWVVYVDPWPLEWGSFLEEGKNVAGCAATRLEEKGHWLIKAEDLLNVLDSVALVSLPEENDDPVKVHSSISQ